jgi:hypothetical protein
VKIPKSMLSAATRGRDQTQIDRTITASSPPANPLRLVTNLAPDCRLYVPLDLQWIVPDIGPRKPAQTPCAWAETAAAL